jgi:hypothetical protein
LKIQKFRTCFLDADAAVQCPRQAAPLMKGIY